MSKARISGMNTHEAWTTNDPPAPLPGLEDDDDDGTESPPPHTVTSSLKGSIPMAQERKRESIVSHEAILSDKPSTEYTIKSSLKVRNASAVPGLSDINDDFADLSPRTSSSGDESDAETTCESMRDLFQKSYEFIKPGAFFRFVVNFYAERKLLVFFWMHFVATMIVWGHFALVKFDQQKNAVPDGAPHYWWKRIAPTLEFG